MISISAKKTYRLEAYNLTKHLIEADIDKQSNQDKNKYEETVPAFRKLYLPEEKTPDTTPIFTQSRPQAPTPRVQLDIITPIPTLSEPSASTPQVHPQKEAPSSLQKLRSRVLDKDDNRARRIYINGMMFSFLLMQTTLFFILLTYTPTVDSLQILWTCHDEIDSFYIICGWMGIMAMLTGLFRTFIDSSFVRAQEILHLRPLPPPVHNHFMQCKNCFVMESPQSRKPGLYPSMTYYFQRTCEIFRVSSSWYRYIDT